MVYIDKRFDREVKFLPKRFLLKLCAYLEILKHDGRLEEPFGKKISKNLFEIRLRGAEHWRVLYAYTNKDNIIILTVFKKKTQKTPKIEIEKANSRLKEYL